MNDWVHDDTKEDGMLLVSEKETGKGWKWALSQF